MADPVGGAGGATAEHRVRVPDADAMHDLGRRLAGLLRAGDLVIATGQLGAGKTALAQGIGAGLGIADQLRSPTYTIADFYSDGRIPFVHVDAWRLSSAAELDDLDLDLEAAATYVEWGQQRAEQINESRLCVDILLHDDDVRTVTFTAVGVDWELRLEALAEH